MNFKEAVELLAVISDFHYKSPDTKPDFFLCDNGKQGYSLSVKTSIVNPEYRSYIEKIVESHKLRMHESEGYLVIHGP